MTPAAIKSFRQSLGLSAEAFGRALGGVDGRTVRGWEAGERGGRPCVPPATVSAVIDLAANVPGVRERLVERGRAQD